MNLKNNLLAVLCNITASLHKSLSLIILHSIPKFSKKNKINRTYYSWKSISNKNNEPYKIQVEEKSGQKLAKCKSWKWECTNWLRCSQYFSNSCLNGFGFSVAIVALWRWERGSVIISKKKKPANNIIKFNVYLHFLKMALKEEFQVSARYERSPRIHPLVWTVWLNLHCR